MPEQGAAKDGRGARQGGAPVALAAAAIVLAAFAAFWNGFGTPFVYDDTGSILQNASLRSLWPLQGPLSPPPSQSVSGRPVANLTLAVNYALGGTRVWGYHATNTLIHALAGLALFGIVRRTLAGPRLDARFGRDSLWLAAAVAALWVLHPLQTESVTYVVQRVESLMGLLYLLTLYCLVRSLGGGRPRLWQACGVVSCLLGMGTKEVMATAPLLVLLYDRTFATGSFRQALRLRGAFYAGLAATWVPLALLVSGTGWSRAGSAGFGHGIGAWAYWFSQLGAVSRYLRLSVWPHPLVFNYGTSLLREPGVSAVGAMVAVPLAAATLYGVARRPAAGFLGAWFLVILAPTSLVPVAEQTMAEHRIYLSLAAVAAAAVLGAHALWGRRIAAPAVVLAAILGSLTVLRNRDYGSAFTLWQGAAASEPGSECAHSGYGVALAESGRLPEAIGEFEEAIRLMPGYAEAQNNLGVALCVQGRLGEGIRHMEAALEVQPGYSEAHFDLGKALEQEGRVPEALRHYEEAVRLRPGFVDAENNLGLLLCREGRVDEGIGRLREAIREDPANVRPHASLGTVLVQQGRRAEAAAEFERIVELNPGDAAARRMVEYLRGSR